MENLNLATLKAFQSDQKLRFLQAAALSVALVFLHFIKFSLCI